jgi:DNA-binding transcriptional LysR family regulator
MQLQQLEVFLAVVDRGGFTAAAARRGTAQPAISAAVRRLERELGARLIARGGRTLTLTPEGQRLVPHARALLAQVATCRREIDSVRQGETGSLSLGAPPMVSAYILPSLLAGFLKSRPGARLRVVQAGAEEIGARVLGGDLDFGIIADWNTPPGLTIHLLERRPMVACVAARSSLARRRRLGWADLLDQQLVLYPRGYHQRAIVEAAAARLGRGVSIVLEAEAVPLITEMVRRGVGVSTVLAGIPHGPGVRTLSLPADAAVPVALCRRADASLGALAEAFERQLTRGKIGER